MKLTQYMAALCVPFLALTACETDIDQVVFNPETATPATLSVEQRPTTGDGDRTRQHQLHSCSQ